MTMPHILLQVKDPAATGDAPAIVIKWQRRLHHPRCMRNQVKLLSHLYFRILHFLLFILQFNTLTGEDGLSGYESTQSDHVKEFSELNYVLSGRCYLTAEQEEKIAALVKKLQPEIPVLVAQLKKSNVKRLNPNLVTCTGLFPYFLLNTCWIRSCWLSLSFKSF
jgi:hypothetical protein